MRQLSVIVPRGEGQRVLELAAQHEAKNVIRVPGGEGERELVLLHSENDRLEALIADLQKLPELHLTLAPQGILAMEPPADEAPEQVVDVSHRSPIEVFLGGLQSIGSWTGFLGYAVAAGVVVWVGLYTDTWFLLTAAMLIAPFAGPAMNLALGTACGDPTLIGRSALRYTVSILVTVASALLLSLLFGQRAATDLMVDQSLVSGIAVLLPLTAGAAGALNLCQSERSSLVTAAGTGMLVAASLAPPAGLTGMALALREWEMAGSGAFVLLLQLVGINLSGAAVFWAFGLTPTGVRYRRGQRWIRTLSLCLTGVVLALMVTFQLWRPPSLQHGSLSHRIEEEVRSLISQHGAAGVVDLQVRFTRADVGTQDALLVLGWVAPAAPAVDPDALERRLEDEIRQRIAAKFRVSPYVDVTVMPR